MPDSPLIAPPEDDTRFRLLHLLQLRPELSQRQIAQELGITPGRVNLLLNALVDKGMLEAQHFRSAENKIRSIYRLTPHGLAERAALTTGFLRRKTADVQALKAGIEGLRHAGDPPAEGRPPPGPKRQADRDPFAPKPANLSRDLQVISVPHRRPRKFFITGTAGFIGFHLASLLLSEGHLVAGYDGMTDCYDVALKQNRHALLRQHRNFSATEAMLEDAPLLGKSIQGFGPDVIVHLAAQAGARSSIQNPRACVDTNIVGTLNVMEAARQALVGHLLMASASSVYGANDQMPFAEGQRTDTPLTIDAATKKANEAMGHAWAHVHGLPITMFRFFTAYGPWGRPDMALFKFTRGIIEGQPIDIHNHGRMWRDFTYVDDLVRGIRLLIDAVPGGPGTAVEGDSLSPVAPFRIVNIGNSGRVRLLDFIEAIEAEVGTQAIRNYMDLQTGDVPATWADATLLHRLTGYRPETPFRDGVARSVAWYRDYHGI